MAMLDEWRRMGLKIGVISNWSARLPGLLQRLGIAERVDFVLCSAIERVEKPDPQMFERALARAGVRADEALHAGDDFEKDVLGAQHVGLRAVLVDHEQTADRAHTPRVRDLHELRHVVAGLMRG
jgi:putative hydrolase of the HAD superfamily